MRKIDEIGICPECECSIELFKTKQYKRFAKCEVCGNSYALPKAGKIETSGLVCPKTQYPILIVHKKNGISKAYFWTDSPCFSCTEFDRCERVKELTEEFTEMQVYGY